MDITKVIILQACRTGTTEKFSGLLSGLSKRGITLVAPQSLSYKPAAVRLESQENFMDNYLVSPKLEGLL
ncbi:hypothetical protein JTB14_030419 [Gonioctena quinquepunctata]|nr:hypothetical protein JTB14_030419 [Gonioctena quinquepunctata]